MPYRCRRRERGEQPSSAGNSLPSPARPRRWTASCHGNLEGPLQVSRASPVPKPRPGVGQGGLSHRGARDPAGTAPLQVPRLSPLPRRPLPDAPTPSPPRHQQFRQWVYSADSTLVPGRPSLHPPRPGCVTSAPTAASYPPPNPPAARTNLLPPAGTPARAARQGARAPAAPGSHTAPSARAILPPAPAPAGPAPPPLAPLPRSREARAPARRECAALPQAAGSGPPRSAREVTAWRGGAGAWRRGQAPGPRLGSPGGSPSPPAPASASRAPPAPAGCPGSAVALPCCASPCWAEAGSGGAGLGAVPARRRQGAPAPHCACARGFRRRARPVWGPGGQALGSR